MKGQTITPDDAVPPFVQPPDKGAIDHATLELLAAWRAADATDNPEDVLAAEKELAEFKKAMNDNRTGSGEPPLYL